MPVPYRHLVPAERVLWERWLALYADLYDRYVYDLHLGEGRPCLPEWDSKTCELHKLLSKKRCDVVGYKPGEICIFEIKPDAGLSAIGQLLSYRALYEKEYAPVEPIALAVITDRIWPDEEWLFNHFGIKYYVLPPPIAP